MANELFVFVLFLSISIAAGDMNCWTRPCVCCKSGQCADLDNKTCDGCIDGYTTPNCFDPCPENCVNCSQLFFNHNDNRTCYICKNGFYNGRYRDKIEQPLQNDCSLSCQTGCETCTSYFNCPQCKTGYFMNFEKECKKCIAHCANCTSPTNCLKCNDGYYKELEACMQCKPNCRTCLTESHCTSCEDGWFLAGNECIPCQSGCKNCFGINKCNSCHKGFYQSNDRCLECSGECANCYDNFTCKECRVNYFLYNGTCKRCGSDCLNCLSDIDCKYCADGYQVYNGKCYECPPLCATCSSNNVCAACKSKSFMLNWQCHPCPTSCVSCSAYENCTACADGYFGQNCSQTCPPDCHGKICNQLTGICISCDIGFYFNDNKQCVNCRKNCLSCTSENSCTLCENGYKGEYCQDECWNCKDGSKCNKTNGYCFDGCMDGFSGPKCNLKCDAKCFTCDRYDRKKCIIHVCINKNKDEIELVSGPCSNSEDMCETGFWGKRCEYYCTTGCRNNMCHRQNGSCILGCATDYKQSQTKDGYCVLENDSIVPVEKNASAVIGLGVAFAISGVVIIGLIIKIFLMCRKKTSGSHLAGLKAPRDTNELEDYSEQDDVLELSNVNPNHIHCRRNIPEPSIVSSAVEEKELDDDTDDKNNPSVVQSVEDKKSDEDMKSDDDMKDTIKAVSVTSFKAKNVSEEGFAQIDDLNEEYRNNPSVVQSVEDKKSDKDMKDTKQPPSEQSFTEEKSNDDMKNRMKALSFKSFKAKNVSTEGFAKIDDLNEEYRKHLLKTRQEGAEQDDTVNNVCS